MDNLRLYNMARSVPPEAQKAITAGRLKGFTDINPMWRIKRLTELFGPCGLGWWYEITGKSFYDDEITKQAIASVDILLYYVDPDSGTTSHGIPGTGGAALVSQERNGPYLSDECYKMALTDAISVAAKALGVGADIYYAKDRDKYTATDEPKKQDTHFTCEKCGAVLKPYEDANGKTVPIRKHAAGSQEKFGAVYCLSCIEGMQHAGSDQ